MSKLKVSFYVLSESKAQDFLGFICQLSQTALNRSAHSLLILIDDDTLLDEIDKALWENEAVSFIPHQRLIADNEDSKAPVLLGNQVPTDFNGIVINITSRAVNDYISATSNAKLTRILEIIKPDPTSVEQGRNKYKSYQKLDYELTHFKV